MANMYKIHQKDYKSKGNGKTGNYAYKHKTSKFCPKSYIKFGGKTSKNSLHTSEQAKRHQKILISNLLKIGSCKRKSTRIYQTSHKKTMGSKNFLATKCTFNKRGIVMR